jgi:hypothetical protein
MSKIAKYAAVQDWTEICGCPRQGNNLAPLQSDISVQHLFSVGGEKLIFY